MSPTRRRRNVVPRHRSRSEIVKAVAVGVGIVGVTALFIWLMRPGPVGVPATGGLINRQPRSSWLIALTVALMLGAAWWILRGGRRARKHAKVLLPATLAVILVAALVAGFSWPGGLLRHDVAPPPVTTPTTLPPATTLPPRQASTTAGRTSTSSRAGTTNTTKPTGTPTTRAPAKTPTR